MKAKLSNRKPQLMVFLIIISTFSFDLNSQPSSFLALSLSSSSSSVGLEKSVKELKKEKKLKKKIKRWYQRILKLKQKAFDGKGLIIAGLGLLISIVGAVIFSAGITSVSGCLGFLFSIAMIVGGGIMFIIGVILAAN